MTLYLLDRRVKFLRDYDVAPRVVIATGTTAVVIAIGRRSTFTLRLETTKMCVTGVPRGAFEVI